MIGKHKITVEASWRKEPDVLEIIGTKEDVHKAISAMFKGPAEVGLLTEGRIDMADGLSTLKAWIDYATEPYLEVVK